MSDFNPAQWLKKAEVHGYGVVLFPEPSGLLGLSMAQPLGRRAMGMDSVHEELNAAPENFMALHAYLLSIGRVRHVPYNPVQKAIFRQMRRRRWLRRSGANRTIGFSYEGVIAVAGERGAELMREGFRRMADDPIELGATS